MDTLRSSFPFRYLFCFSLFYQAKCFKGKTLIELILLKLLWKGRAVENCRRENMASVITLVIGCFDVSRGKPACIYIFCVIFCLKIVPLFRNVLWQMPLKWVSLPLKLMLVGQNGVMCNSISESSIFEMFPLRIQFFPTIQGSLLKVTPELWQSLTLSLSSTFSPSQS